MQKQALGRWGEDYAEKYLLEKEYVIIHRNVQTRYGEIDLIALKENVVVFVEVKTRSTLSYGYPEEAITQAKKEHILQAAEAFLLTSPFVDYDWQVDVIAIQRLSNDVQPVVTHFENAFT